MSVFIPLLPANGRLSRRASLTDCCVCVRVFYRQRAAALNKPAPNLSHTFTGGGVGTIVGVGLSARGGERCSLGAHQPGCMWIWGGGHIGRIRGIRHDME